MGLHVGAHWTRRRRRPRPQEHHWHWQWRPGGWRGLHMAKTRVTFGRGPDVMAGAGTGHRPARISQTGLLGQAEMADRRVPFLFLSLL
jgi:hypothetical protein